MRKVGCVKGRAAAAPSSGAGGEETGSRGATGSGVGACACGEW